MFPEYPQAIWQVIVDGTDISGSIHPRFMSLALTENRGDEADQLDLELSDHDGLLSIPSLGAVIQVAIGWQHTGLYDKGTFTVDEAGHSGAPDVITIRARSADMTGPLRTRNERSFHNKTIKEIVDEIAVANKLIPVTTDLFANKKIQHIDQTNESDMAFLNRIGKRYDAVATVKEDRLIFMPAHGAKTASGQELPIKTVTRADGDRHHFNTVGRDSYTGVKAFWLDTNTGRRKSVVVGVIGNAKQLRDSFANEHDALAAAQAEWQRIRRGMSTMTYDFALGVPDVSVQQRIQFTDLKPGINEILWLTKSLRHQINDSGFTSNLDLEQFEKEDLADEDGQVEIE